MEPKIKKKDLLKKIEDLEKELTSIKVKLNQLEVRQSTPYHIPIVPWVSPYGGENTDPIKYPPGTITCSNEVKR